MLWDIWHIAEKRFNTGWFSVIIHNSQTHWRFQGNPIKFVICEYMHRYLSISIMIMKNFLIQTMIHTRFMFWCVWLRFGKFIFPHILLGFYSPGHTTPYKRSREVSNHWGLRFYQFPLKFDRRFDNIAAHAPFEIQDDAITIIFNLAASILCEILR